MNTIKNILLFIFLLSILTGCEKVFEEDSQNQLNLNNPTDLESAIAGLEYRFSSSIIYTQETPKYLATIFPLLFLNSDDASYITDWSDVTSNDTRFCSQTYQKDDESRINYELGLLWGNFYRTIICANDILKKTKESVAKNQEFKQLLGEVYFYRAYTYFRLTRLFGEVPIILNTDIDFNIKKPSYKDIYNLIENDLNKASQLLPRTNNLARIKYVTPHRGTALALLSEVYLTMGGYPLKEPTAYAKAAQTAGNLIDSATYYGYSILPDLDDLWNGKYELNEESVYAMHFMDIGWVPGYFSDYYSYKGIYLPLGWENGFLTVSIGFYNTFPKSYRKKITYRAGEIIFINGTAYYDTTSLPNTIDICTEIEFKKFHSPFNSISLNTTKGRCIYMLRYATTLLTYAEAKARLGQTDDLAYNAVNTIRRRANKVDINSPSEYDLTPGLSSEQFADSVVQERAWELCGEPDGRYFDLLRLEWLNKLSSLRFPKQGAQNKVVINPQTNFFDIPVKDKMLNPNLSK